MIISLSFVKRGLERGKQIMFGGILVIDLLAITLAVYSMQGQRDFLRESVLTGFILWGAAIFISTETLGFFHAINFWSCLIFWIMVLSAALFVIFKHARKVSLKGLFYSPVRCNVAGGLRPWPFLEKIFFNRIVFFAFCLGIIALFCPPNTPDAMSYHMGRVVHWIQNHTVAYFPTHIPRELYYPAFAEYAILHFQLLSRGDVWANFVQWLAMCGSLTGVSLIAKELGAARRGQIICAMVAITLPMGILQANSTQTDYVETLWLCLFIYFFLRWRKTFRWGYSALAGSALGLAISTKGLAWIVAWPFLLWMIIESIRPASIKKCAMAALAVGIAGLFYAPSFERNAVYFHGNPSGVLSADADSFTNARFCWEGFLANVIRNTGLHVITPSWKVNGVIKQGIDKLAVWLHIDLNNKDWSYIRQKFDVVDFRGIETYLGNPLHLLLFSVVLAFFAFWFRGRSPEAWFYILACFLGWLAFNAILKWQPWNSRFHLPMFVIFSPIAGLVMERIRARWLTSALMGGLFLSGWIIVVINVSKPIFSTLSIFYPQNRDFLHYILLDHGQSDYLTDQGLAQIIHKMGVKNIGLIMGPCETEYPLWMALNPTLDGAMRIESVLVKNSSADFKYPLGAFTPDVILEFDEERPWVNWNNHTYQMIWHHEEQGRAVGMLVKSP